jgi:hypothetical protein
MRRTPWWTGVLLSTAILLLTSAGKTEESDPLPAPTGAAH